MKKLLLSLFVLSCASFLFAEKLDGLWGINFGVSKQDVKDELVKCGWKVLEDSGDKCAFYGNKNETSYNGLSDLKLVTTYFCNDKFVKFTTSFFVERLDRKKVDYAIWDIINDYSYELKNTYIGYVVGVYKGCCQEYKSQDDTSYFESFVSDGRFSDIYFVTFTFTDAYILSEYKKNNKQDECEENQKEIKAIGDDL